MHSGTLRSRGGNLAKPRSNTSCLQRNASQARRGLTLPSSGQPKARFACFRLPLMSNVRPESVKPSSVEFAPLLVALPLPVPVPVHAILPFSETTAREDFSLRLCTSLGQEAQPTRPSVRAMFSEPNYAATGANQARLFAIGAVHAGAAASCAQASSATRALFLRLRSNSRRFAVQWFGTILRHRPPGLTLRCSGLPSAAAELKR